MCACFVIQLACNVLIELGTAEDVFKLLKSCLNKTHNKVFALK